MELAIEGGGEEGGGVWGSGEGEGEEAGGGGQGRGMRGGQGSRFRGHDFSYRGEPGALVLDLEDLVDNKGHLLLKWPLTLQKW